MHYAVILALAIPSQAFPVIAQSACAPGEAIIWSCGDQESMYAVCGSEDLTQTSGYLQYRATKGDETLLMFPASRIHPSGLFSFSLLPRGAILSFEDGEHQYRMHEGVEGEVSFSVSKTDKHSSTVQCTYSDHALTLTDTINRLKAAGVSD